MLRMLLAATVAALLGTGTAHADPLPAVGATLAVNGADGWPSLTWMYDNPSIKDSSGKVVIHWFCAPKNTGCTEDLARITTLKESLPNVYVIAYINGTKVDAKKLDPIRESEGVGRGTVGFGPTAAKWFKGGAIMSPTSIVVGTDNKVVLVTTGSQPSDLDARDAKVKALVGGIKLYTATAGGPTTVKENTKFELSLTIQLASWLIFNKSSNMEFKATVPRDVKCDNTTLKGDQLKPVNQTLTVKMSCTGPHGSYEAQAQIQFGYDVPQGGTGVGADGARWKFEITGP